MSGLNKKNDKTKNIIWLKVLLIGKNISPNDSKMELLGLCLSCTLWTMGVLKSILVCYGPGKLSNLTEMQINSCMSLYNKIIDLLKSQEVFKKIIAQAVNI